MKAPNPEAKSVLPLGQVTNRLLLVGTVLVLMAPGICAAADSIGVACALPYTHSHPDPFFPCVGQHTVTIKASNTDSSAKVTAELLGLDVNGNLINSITVQNGQSVELGSRLSPADWKITPTGSLPVVYAPVPLLHVTVEDRGLRADAYCSDIPYVQIVQPTGGVVTESSGNNTNVLAAVPLTSPGSLKLYVDGVDLLGQVPSNNYLACTPYAPCSGIATINGHAVGSSNLIVDVAWNISTPASNTVRVTLSDLTCGGHIFRVSSSKLPGLPQLVSGVCNADPLSKTGTSSVFALTITDPTPGKVTPLVPTPVAGVACGGTRITGVNINGKDLPVTSETHTPGDGVKTGDVYEVAINTTLDQTDLMRDAFGTHDAPLGTFDAGSNRLAASAVDVGGNRTFKNFIFATGAVAPVAVDPNAKVFRAAAVEGAVSSQLQNLVKERIETAMSGPTTTTLQNAFVVGLSASGAQTLFNSLCTSPINDSSDPSINGLTPGQAFSKKVTQAIQSTPLRPVDFGPCSFCTAHLTPTLRSVAVGTDVSCNLTFNNGSFHVSMGLPAIHVVADVVGSCRDNDPILGTCVDGVAAAVRGTADVTGVTFDFDVTEANLLNNSTTPPVLYHGTTATSLHDITNPFGDQGVSFCGLSSVCKFTLDIFDELFNGHSLDLSIDFSQVSDFSGQIGASKPDPVKLHQIQVDPTVVANFDQKVSGAVSEVHISPGGITAGLVGQFATLALDPSVSATPGITLTPAPVPTLPVANAKDIFIGISDDAINMMFASLTAAGKLQTGAPGGNGCIDTGATVGSLLPDSCDSLTLGDDASTVAARGYCHAVKGDACGAVSFNDPALSAADNANLTATEQGVCYGAQGLPPGQTCSSVANGNLITWGLCSVTPNFNLHAPQPLLFCAKGDVPPRMLFPDTNTSGGSVPAVLRIPGLSVELIADRDQDRKIAGSFADVPGCFTSGASTSSDCNLFSACLDLNLNFSMSFLTCPQDNKPGFTPTFQNVQVLTRQVGTVCGGSTSPTSDSNILSQSSNTQITIPLGQNGAGLAPPICGAGLDLGGFVQCTSPGVLSIRTENKFPESRDYLAITCKVQ